ncbi:hypothetical protein MKX03_017126, partial [Papaver bracteatum]
MSYYGSKVSKLIFKYVQHRSLVLPVSKKYEHRVGMHNRSAEANGAVCDITIDILNE